MLLRSCNITLCRQTLKYSDKIKNLLADSKSSLESCQEDDKATEWYKSDAPWLYLKVTSATKQ